MLMRLGEASAGPNELLQIVKLLALPRAKLLALIFGERQPPHLQSQLATISHGVFLSCDDSKFELSSFFHFTDRTDSLEGYTQKLSLRSIAIVSSAGASRAVQSPLAGAA